MRKHGGTPSRRDKHVTLATISPPGVARSRFVGGHQKGLAGCKPPPLCMRGASSCPSQGQRPVEPWGASPRPRAPTYLPTYISSPFSGVSLDVLVVLHSFAGTQRLKISATRRLEQAFTVECFDDVALFVPLPAPAAS